MTKTAEIYIGIGDDGKPVFAPVDYDIVLTYAQLKSELGIESFDGTDNGTVRHLYITGMDGGEVYRLVKARDGYPAAAWLTGSRYANVLDETRLHIGLNYAGAQWLRQRADNLEADIADIVKRWGNDNE